MVASPPTLRSLAIPTPPDTTKAPSAVLVLSVVLEIVWIPPTFKFFWIPIPPETTIDPELVPVLWYVEWTLTPPYKTNDPVDEFTDCVVSKITIGCSKYMGEKLDAII